jgi:hypothetical protein
MDNGRLDAVPHYRDICNAFKQPGCPLCRLLANEADRYLDAVLWELVNDPPSRSELNQARGYCREHGWLLVRHGAALAVAILTRDVLATVLGVLASHPLEDKPPSAWRDLLYGLDGDRLSRHTAKLSAELAPQRPCPACAHLSLLERDHVGTVSAHLDGPGVLAELYRSSDGLCLDHFRQALARAPSSAAAASLIAAQRDVWERLHAELGEFVRKADFRFREEPFGAERDAWRRALGIISGRPPSSEW